MYVVVAKEGLSTVCAVKRGESLTRAKIFPFRFVGESMDRLRQVAEASHACTTFCSQNMYECVHIGVSPSMKTIDHRRG